MAKSNWCKHGVCEGCSPSGKMTSTSGKSMRCDCRCHEAYKKVKPVRRERDEDEELG